SLYKCTITVKDATYTGSPITPTVTEKNGSTTLTTGTDYTLSCKNNTNVGTGTVTITGKGNYTGSVTKTFSIKAASNTITCCDVSLEKSSSKQTGNLNASAKGGATLTYSSSTSKVTVDSKGKYTVTAGWTGTATITITAAATKNYKKTSDTVKITVASISTNYTGTGSTKDSKYYVTVNGTKFTAGNTFYTYRKCGSDYIKSTGYSIYCSTHRIDELATYVKIGSKYVDVAAGQCLAYAHTIQYLLYGKHDGTTGTNGINSGFKAVSGASGTLSGIKDEEVQSWITTAGVGAHIRVVTKSNGNGHSLIVVNVTSEGFYYTDANSDNKNTIRIGYFSWSSFRSQYKSLSYIRYYTG
ncbi:MAG: hypothetical protein LIO42_00385, partial [Oscillospiraceae bacterium]|nr:hypothetical protein [Oscillospiraceae bacterium]